MRVLPALVLLALCAASAHAQFFTGRQLKEDLDEALAGTSFAKRTISMGYIAGVYDSLAMNKICIRREISIKETLSAVHNYLDAHPENLDQPAAPLVEAALTEAFRCPQ